MNFVRFQDLVDPLWTQAICSKNLQRPSRCHLPFHDRTILVTNCGRICLRKLKIHFSVVFAGQLIGIKEVNDGTWLVSFMNYDLGYFDEESHKFEPLKNPFGFYTGLTGAGDGGRTRDLLLGKQTHYHCATPALQLTRIISGRESLTLLSCLTMSTGHRKYRRVCYSRASISA